MPTTEFSTDVTVELSRYEEMSLYMTLILLQWLRIFQWIGKMVYPLNYALLSDAVNKSDSRLYFWETMAVNGALVRCLMETVVACFSVISDSLLSLRKTQNPRSGKLVSRPRFEPDTSAAFREPSSYIAQWCWHWNSRNWWFVYRDLEKTRRTSAKSMVERRMRVDCRTLNCDCKN